MSKAEPPITIRPASGGSPLETGVEISIRITTSGLGRTTDSYLAMLWHAIQATPPDFEHDAVGQVTEHIGREIIRRWLLTVTPEMWRQQGHQSHWKALTTFARWTGTEWVMKDEAFQAELERRAAGGQEGRGEDR
ncbi:hypothetical protein [Nonomuraea sp. NPDC049646]|uniref:hypothetical protein n=1 Tax=unclassified Nonomuraea TaxID=2593643 RepID=UPI00379C4F66